MEKQKTTKQIVIENKELLKTLKTPKEFYEFAIGMDLDNRARFPHFKKALLKELNIDYDQLKIQRKEEFESDLKKEITQEISLTTDAWGKHARYAIACTEDGEPVNYGKFYNYWEMEQSDAELEAAKYAVGIVAKLMKDNNIPALKLNLTVDAQWLLHQDKYKNKGSELKRLANANQIFLNTIWEPGQYNCADHFTRIKGFQKTDYEVLKKALRPVVWDNEQEIESANTPKEKQKNNEVTLKKSNKELETKNQSLQDLADLDKSQKTTIEDSKKVKMKI